MAFIGLRVPAEVGRLLNTIEVPGEHVSGDTYHVTIAMLGDEVPIEMISKAVEAVYSVASTQVPFQVSLNRVSTFPKNPNGVPVICPIVSSDLHTFHDAIKSALDAAGVDYSKKFPEFKPHVTLSYAEDEMADIPFGGPIDWSVYEVVLWGGDSGDERLSVSFPFSMPGKTALFRRLIQAQMRLGNRA